MPRDALSTRKLLAKIDRGIDVYVVLDRFRQAFYDMDDDYEKLEKRIIILEQRERDREKALDDSGVRKIVTVELTSREARFGTRLFWVLLSGLGALLLAAVGAVLEKWLK